MKAQTPEQKEKFRQREIQRIKDHNIEALNNSASALQQLASNLKREHDREAARIELRRIINNLDCVHL